MFGALQNPVLLACIPAAVIGLILLIARLKVHPFPALILASIFVGICAGMSWSKIVLAFQEGVGTMLGSIAVVIGLGMILGKLLAESGGAEVIARTLIRALGQGNLHWTMMFVAFLVGIPVFFTVGVVLLIPILFTVLRESRRPLLELGIPLVAGMSVVHGLVPPHPGPMAAIGVTHADAGKVILYSLLVGLPTAIIAGPLLGQFIARRVPIVQTPAQDRFVAQNPSPNPPSFSVSVSTVLLPVLLMLTATLADLLLPKGNQIREALDFVGSPTVAMLSATLIAFYTFGFARGLTRERILKLTDDCLGPAAAILLVVGAGGGFNRVLVASGAGEAIASIAQSTHCSPIILGWLVAALIRIATGSATVAITTAAGIVSPFATAAPGTNLELLVVSMGAGSLVLSHVNDGGFWFVKEYFGLTVSQTLQTWTVLETLISVVGLALVLLLQTIL